MNFRHYRSNVHQWRSADTIDQICDYSSGDKRQMRETINDHIAWLTARPRTVERPETLQQHLFGRIAVARCHRIEFVRNAYSIMRNIKKTSTLVENTVKAYNVRRRLRRPGALHFLTQRLHENVDDWIDWPTFLGPAEKARYTGWVSESGAVALETWLEAVEQMINLDMEVYAVQTDFKRFLEREAIKKMERLEEEYDSGLGSENDQE